MPGKVPRIAWNNKLQDITKECKDRNLQIGVPTLEVMITTPFPSKEERSLDAFARLTETHQVVCSAIAYDPIQQKLLLSANNTSKVWKQEITNLLDELHIISTSQGKSDFEKFRNIIKLLCEKNNTRVAKLMRESLPKKVDITKIQSFINKDLEDFKFLKEDFGKFIDKINALDKLIDKRNDSFDMHEKFKDAYEAAVKVINSFYEKLLGPPHNQEFYEKIKASEGLLEIIAIIDKFRGTIEDLHKVARAFVIEKFDWTQHITTEQRIVIEDSKGTHAESNIMAYIIDELKKDPVKFKSFEDKEKVIYIGVSKLSCVTCEHCVATACDFDFTGEGTKFHFSVRGGHGFTYSNPPQEYVLNEEFWSKFQERLGYSLEIRKTESSKQTDAPQAPRSPSICNYDCAWENEVVPSSKDKQTSLHN